MSNGASAAVQAPTQSARVEVSSAIPSRAKLSLCRFSGRCWQNFASRIIASSSGPARPRAIGWNGAGGWVIVSQARQVNRSRTVWITFHWRGITSSVSVTSSPSLATLPLQHGQAVGPGITTRSRGRCAGKPAISGRQVRCGARQSIPSNSMDSIAGVSETTPSLACGQTKRPRSSRLA